MDETWIHPYIPESNRSSAEWREAGESRSKRMKASRWAEMAKRVRFKLSDLSDEQLLELYESIPSDGELSSISSDDEDEDFNVVEALTDALEDVSFIDSYAENVPNNSQEPELSR
ncbi:hypothetical protein ACLKA7_011614 [Drosophila subpalustris]